jgi:hypothetical protein
VPTLVTLSGIGGDLADRSELVIKLTEFAQDSLLRIRGFSEPGQSVPGSTCPFDFIAGPSSSGCPSIA